MIEIEKKILNLKELFNSKTTAEARYHLLMELGRTLPPYPFSLKIPDLQVQGCQSILYLSMHVEDGKLFFNAASDALISSGLAALLISIYSGETPETILKTSPAFLGDLGLLGSLTPSRSNGLAHIHQRMKSDALKALVSRANRAATK